MNDAVSAEDIAWHNGRAAGQAQERAAILTWIKSVYGLEVPTSYMNPGNVVRAIERGEHLRDAGA